MTILFHWGMFNIALNGWFELVEESEKCTERYVIKLISPKLGQLASMESQNIFDKWWKILI